MDNLNIMKLSLLTLKFSGESSSLEVPFKSEYFRASLPHNRAALIVGALFYSVFGILDMLLMPETKSAIWLVRFAIVNPMLIGIFLLSFSKSFEHFINPLMSCASILAGGGIIYMVVIAPPPVSYSYYAGLLLVFMWSYAFVRIPFLWASMSGWVLVVLYQIVAIWISPTPFYILLNNNFFFISANIMGMIACYSLEYYARRDFFLAYHMNMERAKIDRVNRELETKTMEYQVVNQKLEQEIDARRQAEEVLQESEEKFRLIAENTGDVIAVMDMNLSFTFVSPSIKRSLGYTVEEFMNMPLDRIMTPGSLEKLLNVYAEEMKLEATGSADPGRIRFVEVEEYTKDGSIVWRESSISAQRDRENKPIGIITVSRDITLRKKAEEALRESEEKFRKLTEASNVGITITDGQRFLYVNPATRKMSGFSEEEYLSMPMIEFVTPDSRELIYQRAMDRLAGKPVPDRYEISVLSKEGGVKWAEVGATVIEYHGKPATIFTMLDITDRKKAEAEKESLQAQLLRAQKMEALGQLAGGVAHDLNNVLGILSGYSELLLMEIPEGQRARGHVEKIFQSTEKGAAIIQDLLTLARRGVTIADVINLNKVVADFLETPVFDKMKDFHPRVTFRTECQEDLLNIKGSPMHLEKTLMNLVSNAAESISGMGEVIIRTQSRYLDTPVRGYDEIKEGDYTILTVSDTGMGIPVEHREKIFEPFYTKKAMGRSGTGLGLAIVWGTVKDHNGYIDVQTEVGEGTTFTLYFPVTREELVEPQQRVPVESYLGKGESVLVIDDIAGQREIASGLLRKLGYEVQAVSSGEEAVEYLRANKADILVLDMIMAPGIDGLETYERVLKINPQQKAILVSGFSETDRVKKAQRLGAGAYVKKPYVVERIGIAIRDEFKR
jgi:PAS domain S-box-containing protein